MSNYVQSNYVQQMWDSQSYGYREHGKGARIATWIVGVLAALSITAYATQQLWYPYVSPYLY